MTAHLIAFCIGFVLDMIFGDPEWLYHPVRLIGKLISALEKRLLDEHDIAEVKVRCGFMLVAGVIFATGCVSLAILTGAYIIHPYVGIAVESIMTYQLLATKSLRKESMKVYDRLSEDDIEGARQAVSMIVGRDTSVLDKEGIERAAVETVAENLSDGVIAPMLYTAIGGPVLGFVYKAVNTMDSMVGYKNDRYLFFGRCAARLDDMVNLAPARISSALMIAATSILRFGAVLGGRAAYDIYSVHNAIYIYARDRKKHASPNSAHTESVCAGALGIRLAGPAVYFGKTYDKPYLGDALRQIETEDIKRANKLLYATAFVGFGICTAVIGLAIFVI